MGEIFANHVSDKGLVSTLPMKPSQPNNKTNHPT